MYAQYWGLQESPFRNTLDPRWFHQSPGHEEALARLLFIAEERRQCGALVGTQGAGKSLLLLILERELRRTQREFARVDLQGRTAQELVWETGSALGLGFDRRSSYGDQWRALQDHLLANEFSQLPTVLAFDHLDGADEECTRALLRLHHLGQTGQAGVTLFLTLREENLPRWGQLLAELSDLRIELPELEPLQTPEYVESLLRKAGATRTLFETAALDEIHLQTQGNPRKINRLCDLCLLAGMAEGESRVTAMMVASAAEEIQILRRPARGLSWTLPVE